MLDFCRAEPVLQFGELFERAVAHPHRFAVGVLDLGEISAGVVGKTCLQAVFVEFGGEVAHRVNDFNFSHIFHAPLAFVAVALKLRIFAIHVGSGNPLSDVNS